MKLRFSVLALALGAAMMLPMTSADAHGIWFAQRAKQTALIYGVGADDLDAVKRFGMFENAVGYDAQYNPIKAQLRIAGPVVLIDADEQPTLLTAVMQNGVWSRMNGSEYEKKTLEEMPNADISERTIKYTVSIQGPLSKPIPPLAGHTLQIIPVGAIPDLLGKPLKYQVLFQGKPYAGATVINDMINDPDAKAKTTDKNGMVTMPVRNQGLNVIRAVMRSPTDDPKKYKILEHTATLSFTLAHAPE